MGVIGYIVTKNKIENILSCIKVVSSYRSIEDKNKPILIIGLEEAKKHASSFSILEKKIGEKMFWTFGKREKRTDYEKDIEKFQEYVLKCALNEIKYYYLNILTVKYHKIKKLIEIVNNADEKIFYVDKKMFYMYYNNYVLGISVDILEYLGVKKKKILDIIQKNEKNKVFFNDFKFNYKIKKLIESKKYITPYFLSLEID
jgi:hypothetical protein